MASIGRGGYFGREGGGVRGGTQLKLILISRQYEPETHFHFHFSLLRLSLSNYGSPRRNDRGMIQSRVRWGYIGISRCSAARSTYRRARARSVEMRLQWVSLNLSIFAYLVVMLSVKAWIKSAFALPFVLS